MLWFIHVIMSVNTHLRRRILMAVLHNAAEQSQIGLQPDLPSGDGRATPNYSLAGIARWLYLRK